MTMTPSCSSTPLTTSVFPADSRTLPRPGVLVRSAETFAPSALYGGAGGSGAGLSRPLRERVIAPMRPSEASGSRTPVQKLAARADNAALRAFAVGLKHLELISEQLDAPDATNFVHCMRDQSVAETHPLWEFFSAGLQDHLNGGANPLAFLTDESAELGWSEDALGTPIVDRQNAGYRLGSHLLELVTQLSEAEREALRSDLVGVHNALAISLESGPEQVKRSCEEGLTFLFDARKEDQMAWLKKLSTELSPKPSDIAQSGGKLKIRGEWLPSDIEQIRHVALEGHLAPGPIDLLFEGLRNGALLEESRPANDVK